MTVVDDVRTFVSHDVGWAARADAFLFGRRTYEIFAGSWGFMKDPSQSPIGQALHSRRKYVASSTLTKSPWADTTVIAGEVAAVSELEGQAGR